jgi:tripeptide aminopeptidase
VKRLRIIARTEGGHSWLHFGRASAVHGLMQLGTRILNISPLSNPRTTYNIGLVEGGQSINTIAAEASMWLDMRSESTRALNNLEEEVRKQIKTLQNDELRFEVQVVGDRPAGQIATDHLLVQGAMAALERLGVQGSLENGSTDGNIPLSAGVPTVTVGVTRGGNAHRLDEFVEIGPVADGLRQLVMLVLAASQHLAR